VFRMRGTGPVLAEAAAAIKRSPLDGCAESMDKEAASEACIRTTRSSKKGLEIGT